MCGLDFESLPIPEGFAETNLSQASSVLRRADEGFANWCPGCEEMHILPDSWQFDGNLEKPTFRPSFKHSCLQRVFVEGNWTGEWKRDASGNTIPFVCHYNLVAGQLQFCSDCTHAMVAKTVPLPQLPQGLTD